MPWASSLIIQVRKSRSALALAASLLSLGTRSQVNDAIG